MCIYTYIYVYPHNARKKCLALDKQREGQEVPPALRPLSYRLFQSPWVVPEPSARRRKGW